MPDNQLLLDAFRNSNFQDAREILKKESNIPIDLQPFERVQLFDKLIRNKAFDIVFLFIRHQLIETDLYEYNTFNHTLLKSIFLNLQQEEEDIIFFDEFLSTLQNLDEVIDNQTLLGHALESGVHPLLIKSLINAGCDINWVSNAEETYLHQITSDNRVKPENAAVLLDLMINEGLDVNAIDIVKKTPLINAISRNKVLLIDLLLKNGAGSNIPDNMGETAFYHAIVHQQNLPLYENLRSYETPDFEIPNKNKETILFEFLRRLNRPSETLLNLLTELIKDGADLYAPAIYYGKEKTPADIVAEKTFDVFNTVIRLDVLDLTRLDQNGNSLLHKVCAFDVNFDLEMAKDTYRKVKLLIQKGIDINLTNNQDQTAMMLASTDNLKAKTVELLLTNK
ncbi:ankyrin repeat domain-containing protein [Pedobacter antarcticus]|uniref:ankyrin repeat domain-containing protein n=1 Tax=Pedobacter antarcticus TaxID=34086 RepID=UPI00292D7DF9|nr:ankyrin repeat domain-containing protein [Pedobacter antarcticus]